MKQRRVPSISPSNSKQAHVAKAAKAPPIPLSETALTQVSGGVKAVAMLTPKGTW